MLTLRVDEATWASGSAGRKAEWRLAMVELVQEGHFAKLSGGASRSGDGQSGEDSHYTARLTLAPRSAQLVVEGADGARHSQSALPVAELWPLMEEYMRTCEELARLGVGGNSPRLEALDIAKRITHDEAGELIVGALPELGPDHSTARRIFTLLVTLYFDTTRIGGTAHLPIS